MVLDITWNLTPTIARSRTHVWTFWWSVAFRTRTIFVLWWSSLLCIWLIRLSLAFFKEFGCHKDACIVIGLMSKDFWEWHRELYLIFAKQKLAWLKIAWKAMFANTSTEWVDQDFVFIKLIGEHSERLHHSHHEIFFIDSNLVRNEPWFRHFYKFMQDSFLDWERGTHTCR